MQTRHKYMAFILVAVVAAVVVFKISSSRLLPQPIVKNSWSNSSVAITTDLPLGTLGMVAGASTEAIKPQPQLLMPISIGLSRVTKKTFGLYVTPATSPVSNDIFTGFHTGIDFETFADEQDIDITITASCDGIVRQKKWDRGYGGVLVQSCKLDDEDVTVIYGHLKLDSITATMGQTLLAGDKIGYLGQGFTKETDGRRKHLHFDIHKGYGMNTSGYVQKETDLENWLDPVKYLE